MVQCGLVGLLPTYYLFHTLRTISWTPYLKRFLLADPQQWQRRDGISLNSENSGIVYPFILEL